MKYLKEEDKKKKKFPVGIVLIMLVLAAAAFAGGTWFGTTLSPVPEVQTPPAIEPVEEPATEPTENPNEQEEIADVPVEETAEPEMEQPTPVNQMEVYRIEGEDIVVPTPYSDIYYSAKFAEFLQISHRFSDNIYSVCFQTDLGIGETITLFEIHFARNDGHQPEGEILGGMYDAEGKPMLVIAVLNPDIPNPEWDDDTINLVYAMQESISNCIDQLSKSESIILDQ